MQHLTGSVRVFRDSGFDQKMARKSGNDKYIDGIRDLTVPWEAGLAKNWARDAEFMFECRSGMPQTVATNLVS